MMLRLRRLQFNIGFKLHLKRFHDKFTSVMPKKLLCCCCNRYITKWINTARENITQLENRIRGKKSSCNNENDNTEKKKQPKRISLHIFQPWMHIAFKSQWLCRNPKKLLALPIKLKALPV